MGTRSEQRELPGDEASPQKTGLGFGVYANLCTEVALGDLGFDEVQSLGDLGLLSAGLVRLIN